MSFYLTQALHRSARQHPARLATVCGDRRHDYRKFAERVARLAGALQGLGVESNDRVAMLALNSDRYLEYYLACFWAGAVANPINVRWSAAEVLYALNDAGASVLIVDDQFLALGQSIRERCPGMRHLIHAGDGPTPGDTLRYETLLMHATLAEDVHRNGRDLAFLLYTGGTTGVPKGVMLSHDNVAVASLGMSAMGCGSGDVMLHAVPSFHAAGVQMMFNHFIRGGSSVVITTFNPLLVLRAIAVERVTDTMLVPTMLQMLIEHPSVDQYDLGSLRRVFYGAAPVSETVLLRATQVLPNTEFIQGYGMTETGITIMLPGYFHTIDGQKLGKLRAAGLALPHTEVKIVDGEDRDLPPGTPGEILVRGPTVMLGYWNQLQQSAETLKGGWMHTGDVGFMDQEGFVFIVDRLKDMIISGGENVYSSEVENALAKHPAVAQCAVIGVPSDKWGEVVHAVVVKKLGIEVSAEALGTHCRSLIAAYKCPRSMEFRDSLPLSAAGKLLKNELREPYWKTASPMSRS